jgi:hypothetical protein
MLASKPIIANGLPVRKIMMIASIYVLTLRAEKHVTDPIKSLRALLKIAGRQFGLKAIQIREQRDDIAVNARQREAEERAAAAERVTEPGLPSAK